MKQIIQKLGMIAVTLLSFLSAYSYDFEVDGIYYDVESLPEMTCCISGGKPELTSVTLPSSVTLNGRVLKVLRVKENAWNGNVTLSSVELSEGLDSIAPSAFEGCVKLESLNLGSVKGIAKKAFYGCEALKDITLPGSLLWIGENAFALDYRQPRISTNITFSEGNGLLYGVPAEPNTMDKKGVFGNRYASKIILNRDIHNFGDAWGNFEQLSIGERVTYFPPYLGKYMTECDLSTSNITIIGNEAFSGSLQKITLPAKLESIGSCAFLDSDIKEIVFPQSLRAIGSSAFSRCYYLKNPVLPTHLEYMGSYAFANCSAITDITIPGSLSIVPPKAFRDCQYLKSVDIKEGVEAISEYAFSKCESLILWDLPSSLKTIEEKAFSYCESIESFTIPSTLHMIGADVFEGCSKLSKLVFEESDNPLYFQSSVEDNKTISYGGGWYDTEEEANQHPYVWVCYLKSPFILDNLSDVSINRNIIPVPTEEPMSDMHPGEMAIDFNSRNYNYTHLLYVANSNLETLTIGEKLSNPFLIPEPLVQEWVKYDVDSYGRYNQINYKATYNFSPTVYPSNLEKLKVINCKFVEPPVLDADFPTGVYIAATLNVPIGSKQAYENAPYWKNFWGIQESEFSGINDIYHSTTETYVVYNLQGMLVSRTKDLESLHRLPAGIYIVNGKKIAIR